MHHNFHIYSIAILVLIAILNSCVSDFNFETQNNSSHVVLNSVLENDSSITIRLCRSETPSDTSFQSIIDASLNLWENEVKINKKPIISLNGYYSFDHVCKSNNHYRIEAIVNEEIIKSKTTTPLKPTLKIKPKDNPIDFGKAFYINISQVDESVSALYIYAFYLEKQFQNDSYKWMHTNLYCNSAVADPFNRFFDSMLEGFHYSFDYFIRIDAAYLYEKAIKLQIACSHNGSDVNTKLSIIAAHNDYDKYYKSAYLQRSFDPDISLPFSYYPVPIPNNINGGLGIFSSIDISTFEFSSTKK